MVKGALERIRREPETCGAVDGHCDLQDWFDRIVASVDRWPAIATDGEAEHVHFSFGQGAARMGIPLHQIVRALHLLKNRIIDFARSQGMGNALEIYVEEELENRISFFFDWLLYHAVLGYESVHPMRLAAPQSRAADVRDLPGWVPL